MTQHSPEPWRSEESPNAYDGELWIVDKNDQPVLNECAGTYDMIPPEISPGNVERIIACVNACWGIPTEDLKNGPTKVLWHKIFQKLAEEGHDQIACSSCKHWHEQADGYAGQKEGFGVCENAQHIDDWNIDTANTMMAVIDGEDYFAALLTKPGHSCADWILND